MKKKKRTREVKNTREEGEPIKKEYIKRKNPQFEELKKLELLLKMNDDRLKKIELEEKKLEEKLEEKKLEEKKNGTIIINNYGSGKITNNF